MKKLFALMTLLITGAFFLNAQSIKEAKDHIYYQRYETAKNILQNNIMSQDQSPDAYYYLAEIYMTQKKYDSAKMILETGMDYVRKNNISQKSNPLPYIGWAHVLLNEGKTDEARLLMEEVLAQRKYKDADALYATGRANVDSKNGDINYAVKVLSKAIKRDKKNPFVYTALADAYKKVIDGSNAVVYYDWAIRVDPAFAEAMYKKGRLYKSHNNPEVYLEKFRQAVQMDEKYAPAYYELYYYYFYKDVVMAKQYLDLYSIHTEPSMELNYMQTDLKYVSQKYDDAIISANQILMNDKTPKARLYKLIAYSQAAIGDSTDALKNMNLYFDKQDKKDFVAKDYELKARLLENLDVDKTKAVEWYKKALALEKDDKEKVGYFASLADLQKELGNRDREAMWREQYYRTKERPTNLDLYKWGTALYSSENYEKSDSVFSLYQKKYPDQVYGYLWRARANAMIDTAMEKGLAVPHYKGLIEVASRNKEKNKAVILRAYDYLGIYEANITKDYPTSLGYFEKMLELDPTNSDGLKYSVILKQWIEKAKTNSKGTGTGVSNKADDKAGK